MISCSAKIQSVPLGAVTFGNKKFAIVSLFGWECGSPSHRCNRINSLHSSGEALWIFGICNNDVQAFLLTQ